MTPNRMVGNRSFDFSRQVAVIAVIDNDPSKDNPADTIETCERATVAGADWIDIRGASLGPGGKVSAKEELDRLLPVLLTCRERTDAVISVKTSRSEVARRALQAGADAINDASGMHNPELAGIVGENGAGLIIAHSLAEPPAPTLYTRYSDIASRVGTFLRERAQFAIRLGLRRDQIFIDPGYDLHKNTYHSLQLKARLHEITSIGYPTVVSVPGNPFIKGTLDQATDKLEGVLATIVVCILQGARLVRIHDAPSAVAAVRTTEAILGWRQPAAPRHNLA